MAASPIKFGTSGWRGIIAEDFTFGNVRIAVGAIAEHVLSRNAHPTLLVAHDTRFFSEEFARAAPDKQGYLPPPLTREEVVALLGSEEVARDLGVFDDEPPT